MPPAPQAGGSQREPYGLLRSVSDPADLRRLAPDQLPELAAEIRAFLIEQVSQTGGHLGPNLGVVELSIALHRVFESPVDRIVWDTGHQSYVHKILTGRQDFSKLRGKGGLSGYPSREESEHDVIENSHASTALGWADGLAKARQVRGGKGQIFVKGEVIKTVPESKIVETLIEEAMRIAEQLEQDGAASGAPVVTGKPAVTVS